MKARTSISVLAAVAACGAIAFMVLGRGDDEAATVAPKVGTASHTAVPALQIAAPPAVARVDAPIQRDDTVYPVDPTPAAVEVPLTEDERDPRMARSIEMLDQAVARAEARVTEAEATGDQAAANIARIRIKRLQEVRKQRAAVPGSVQ
ncbi:hypothetical protein BH11MYX3_BH11MYX3_02520 [soil metagenome]